jgi:hypothetical protein
MTIRSIGAYFAILAVAAFFQAAPAEATSWTINCRPNQTKVVTSTLIPFSSTTSTTFVDIPEATVQFVVGGTTPSCVIVRFSGESSSNENASTIRPLLDVNTKALPAEVAFGGLDCSNGACTTRAHAFEFVFPRVAPGTHLLRMQYEAAFPPPKQPVYIGRHNTVVQYFR